MSKKDNFPFENLARTLIQTSSNITKNAMFGNGPVLGTYYGTHVILDNFNKPINDFYMLNFLKQSTLTTSTENDHSHTVSNPCYVPPGSRVLCVEINSDVVIIGKVG